jgi:hypothetical protein
MTRMARIWGVGGDARPLCACRLAPGAEKWFVLANGVMPRFASTCARDCRRSRARF